MAVARFCPIASTLTEPEARIRPSARASVAPVTRAVANIAAKPKPPTPPPSAMASAAVRVSAAITTAPSAVMMESAVAVAVVVRLTEASASTTPADTTPVFTPTAWVVAL